MAVGIRRLTVGQALVEFLIEQRTERDGVTRPLFAGVFGIFGHGNVAGLGEALLAARDRLRFYLPRNEQAMVHTAAAFAKMRNRLQTFACTSSIGPGATNMLTAAAGDDQPAAGSVAARRHLRNPARGTGAATARSRIDAPRVGERL